MEAQNARVFQGQDLRIRSGKSEGGGGVSVVVGLWQLFDFSGQEMIPGKKRNEPALRQMS